MTRWPFEFLSIPHPRSKPRSSGLTFVIDWGHPIGRVRDALDLVGPFFDIRDEFPEQPLRAHRRPFRAGHLSHTADGRPVAPLMGRATRYDGGHTGIVVEPFFSVQAANDYATVFSIRPTDVRRTEMMLQWLVRGDAREGRDYDLDRMTEVWHVTSLEDEWLVDNHQRGVETRAYRPGPYHPKEAMSMRATAWYLAQLRKAFG